MNLSTFITVFITCCLLYFAGYFALKNLNLTKRLVGDNEILNPWITPANEFSWFIAGIILQFLVHFFGCVLMFLIIIFILWMIIKYIIPYAIPIIPPFVWIPIRPILLAIPPFPEFTEAGILPLMERLFNVFGGGSILLRKIGMSIEAILAFLVKGSRYVFISINPNLDPEKHSRTVHMNKDGTVRLEKGPYTDNTKGKYDAKEQKQDENTQQYLAAKKNAPPYFNATILSIDTEKTNCIRQNRKDIKPYFTELQVAAAHAENAGIAVKCEARAIAGYVRANIG